ncbi:hypothetical protein ZIOFF_033471 [Zingiber officinale]|uniref:Uncharacterized protein n=1 Tax=Zingiber officinale TaxID=94328 RepID=A0A8J5GK12_ZINOF|nr:hypothetical protein ZIOFF_033471 [Zingiber officinale]
MEKILNYSMLPIIPPLAYALRLSPLLVVACKSPPLLIEASRCSQKLDTTQQKPVVASCCCPLFVSGDRPLSFSRNTTYNALAIAKKKARGVSVRPIRRMQKGICLQCKAMTTLFDGLRIKLSSVQGNSDGLSRGKRPEEMEKLIKTFV